MGKIKQYRVNRRTVAAEGKRKAAADQARRHLEWLFADFPKTNALRPGKASVELSKLTERGAK